MKCSVTYLQGALSGACDVTLEALNTTFKDITSIKSTGVQLNVETVFLVGIHTGVQVSKVHGFSCSMNCCMLFSSAMYSLETFTVHAEHLRCRHFFEE